MEVVEAQAGAVFTNCFQLLSRVSEVDSMVRVLHLVTVMLEALGPKAQPHFAAITAALPKVSSPSCVAVWIKSSISLCCHHSSTAQGELPILMLITTLSLDTMSFCLAWVHG